MIHEPRELLNKPPSFQFSREDIAEYYDTHQSSYSRFWSRCALHYGFWYDDTKSLAEAISNTDKFLVDILEINSADRVLDAGCGVGGTSTYMAENTGARVDGITLSAVQLQIAKERAVASRATSLLSFSQQDFTCTTFQAATFTKVFGIESVCYAINKLDFLVEAYRILKPGGRIAVVDTFLTKEDLGAQEQEIYAKFMYGWVVPNLPTQARFHDYLIEAGFADIKFWDMQQYIEPSVRVCYRYSLLTAPWNHIKSQLGLARKNLSARYQKAAFEREIVHYGVFSATKPFDP